MHKGEQLPRVSSVDLLIVLSGPIGVYEEESYPWLLQEKKFIRHCISRNKKVLGINLGAQLIAEVLGANVQPNKVKEIGWYQISWNRNAQMHPQFDFLPSQQIVFHWHRDTFDLPPGAKRLASSIRSKNQAFLFEDNVMGFQFHMELKYRNLQMLIDRNRDMLKERGPHIQSAEHMLDRTEYMELNNNTLIRLLDRYLANVNKTIPATITPDMYC